MDSRAVTTAMEPNWLELSSDCRPHGKCLLLTCEGIAVIGEFDGDFDSYVAFFALPRIPGRIKQRLHRSD